MEPSNMAMNYKIVHKRERGDFHLNVSRISLPSSLDSPTVCMLSDISDGAQVIVV